MKRTAPLDVEALLKLGFKRSGNLWFHTQEERFGIQLFSSFFYVSFHGYQSNYPYSRIVEVLEKQFFERTGKLLY